MFSCLRRDPARKDPPASAENGELLCAHAGLLYRPSADLDADTK